MALKLDEPDHIVTAYAEKASGPGWANRPLFVVLRNSASGVYRVECVQPEDQPPEVQYLYEIADTVHRRLCAAVEKIVRRRKIW
jgi:hypothetical protein